MATVSDFEDHHSSSYDIFSFEISQPGESNSRHHVRALGIDALSPHTDDVIFPMKNAEGRGPFSSSSIIGGAIGSHMPVGERPMAEQFLRSASWGEHHHQSPPPPHIVGLFSPSDRSDSFMRSLSLSPRVTPASSYSNSYDPTQPSSRDDDSIQFLLSPRDQFASKVSSPQKSPRVYSEHEEWVKGMGGMELDLDIELDEDAVIDETSRDSIMSPTHNTQQSSLMAFSNLRQHQFTSQAPHDEISEHPNRVLVHSHSYTSGIYDQQHRDAPVRADNSPASGTAAVLGDLEGVPCTATFGEHPFGEHPSRTLFVRNINSNVEDDELATLFEAHGPIRSMYTQCKHRGFVMISYYDIRHAKNAMRHLQGKIIRRRKLDIHYSIPKDNPSEKDQNQGTLVIFNLDPATTNEELKSIFGQYGEIKEIRETPNKKHHKFIEFYDVRDSEKAMKHLNKTEIKGKKIKIEPSRPGGARKNQMNQLALELSGDDDPSPQASHNGSLSPMPNGFLMPSAAHSAPSSIPLYYPPYSPTSGQLSPSFRRSNNQSPQLNQSAYAHIHSLLPSTHAQSTSPSPGVSPRSQSTSPSPIINITSGAVVPPHTHTPIPIPTSSTAASSSAAIRSGVPFIPIATNLSSNSQNSSKEKISLQDARHSLDRLSLNFGDTMSLIPAPATTSAPNQTTGAFFQPRQGGGFVRPPHAAQTVSTSSPMGLINAPASTNVAPVTHAPLPIPTSGTPVAAFVTSGAYMSSSAPGGHSVSGGNMSTVARWSPLPAESVSLRFPITSNGEVYISPPSSNPTTPTQSPRVIHASNSSSNNNGNKSAMMKSPRGLPSGVSAVPTSNSISPTNGNKKSTAHQEDKAQYTLHIDRVRIGQDIRTTLMIKNIPNKYSQKMLLAAVDEHHHGYYDFFYLPIDFKNKCNVGYAFINFINFRSIVPFYEEFNNKKWEKFNSEKVCEITYARIQGKSALIGHFQNSSLMSYEDKKCRPIIIFHRDGTNTGEQKLFPSAMFARSKPKGKEDRVDAEYSPLTSSLP